MQGFPFSVLVWLNPIQRRSADFGDPVQNVEPERCAQGNGKCGEQQADNLIDPIFLFRRCLPTQRDAELLQSLHGLRNRIFRFAVGPCGGSGLSSLRLLRME